MNARIESERAVRAVPLLSAVFCAGCETISYSPHDTCTVCGSHSLTSLWRLLGGKLPSDKAKVRKTKYNLELIVKVREIPAAELEHLLQSLTRLAEVGDGLECVHVNVESIFDAEPLIRAA